MAENYQLSCCSNGEMLQINNLPASDNYQKWKAGANSSVGFDVTSNSFISFNGGNGIDISTDNVVKTIDFSLNTSYLNGLYVPKTGGTFTGQILHEAKVRIEAYTGGDDRAIEAIPPTTLADLTSYYFFRAFGNVNTQNTIASIAVNNNSTVYSFPYTDYWLGYHDYWYRLYHDDFWYYDYDPSEDNNCQPLKQEWNQVKKRIKDYRKTKREEKEERKKRRKKIWQKWREIRRERWAQVDSISRRPRPKEIFRFHPRTSQKRKK